MHKAWSRLGEVPYCFSRSPVKFQGHTAQKIVYFHPNWEGFVLQTKGFQFYGTPNRIDFNAVFSISENDFLMSENQFLISENVWISYIRNYFLISDILFWYQKLFFWYQKMPGISDIRNYFLISEINIWYKKCVAFSYIRKFLISDQKIISDIRNSWHFLI